jgi:glutamyl-Q tRNA(Asp) synthetase
VGSLRTAVASWLDARAHGGQWLVRIEDVDRARSSPAHAGGILRTLEAAGLTWDGPVWYQSERYAAYAAALEALAAQNLVYPCTCTRRELAGAASEADVEPVYPGRCRAGVGHPGRPEGLRLRIPPGAVEVVDRLQGRLVQDVAAAAGDFLLKRRDGDFAYQLAVVVDDVAQRITDVVRGADLWEQTPRQQLLQRIMGWSAPRYLHVPLVVEPDGAKLSKSRRALAVDVTLEPALHWVLGSLGLPPPPGLAGARPPELLQWAVQHWDPLAGGRDAVPAPA